MPRMTTVNNGQLVSIESQFKVQIKTNAEGAELWLADVAFNQTIKSQLFSRVRAIGANFDGELLLDTPEIGHLYVFRLFGGVSGSPSGNGNLIDELKIPRLKSGRRRDYLTMCSEGVPQLGLDQGGTFVRAGIASGKVKTRAQLLLTDAKLEWFNGEFPKLSGADVSNFVLASASETTLLMNEVTVVDMRADGWPDSRRLGPGATVRFVALVWDDEGGFDFTWTSLVGIPSVAAASTIPPEELTTKLRRVDLLINKLVCLDDSDRASDGEASFVITVTPGAPGSPDVRNVTWDPMETGSSTVLNEQFQMTGPAADVVTIAVSGTEDDSDSFPSDDDDHAAASVAYSTINRGPGTETFTDYLTLDSQVGDDGFHFLMYCKIDVSYP